MLQIQELKYYIGKRKLLQNINWTIHPGQRAALIGPNGAGKTTLLRILSGQIDHFEGSIIKPRDFQIGYLPQEEIVFEKGVVLRAVMEGYREALIIEEEIDAIHDRLENDDIQHPALLNRLGELEARYSAIGGYELEARAKKILAGLGFKQDDFHRPLHDLSGGWRMRVYLARLLLQQPDLLLLDEPTNHLDLESLEWMEGYLKSFKGSMIIVSHDRFFIDRLAQQIAELERGKLKVYAGNYHFYEQKKQLDGEQLFKKWLEQKEERERLQKFIDRFRYKATKAAQVQSRVKQLEKMERIELPEERRTIHFKIKADTPSFKEVLTLRNVHFRYATEWVLHEINLDLYRGEKVALVGPNGAGKTTFTRLISGELLPQMGDLKVGERVHTGYYAQHQVDALHLDMTIYEEVAATAARSFQPKLRDILGVFQFSGDDINKPIAVLSGGEKARVSLAKILLSPGNFLIMDEPTNHLDLASKEALEQALSDYDGTLLLISHDRYFLDKLVHSVLEMRDGRLREFVGSYSEYLDKRESELQSAAEEKLRPVAEDADVTSGGKKSKEQKRIEAELRQSISKERNRLKKEIDHLENEIEHLEHSKSKIESCMADPQTYQDGALAAQLKKEYDQICQTIPELETRWETAQQEHEEVLRKTKSIERGAKSEKK